MVSGADTPGFAQRRDAVYRTESRGVFATLMRLLGDFDHAEEALHEAFRAALEQTPRDGMSANPRAWLVSAGRFKAINSLRRDQRYTAWDDAVAETIAADASAADEYALLEDDRLCLIFTCCHPSLAEEAQPALTLREVCDLTTEEIAHAFLLPTLAQPIVRAKAKIRVARTRSIGHRPPRLCRTGRSAAPPRARRRGAGCLSTSADIDTTRSETALS